MYKIDFYIKYYNNYIIMLQSHSITSFNQVNIIPNSLIVLDIDDTILGFDGIDDKWWIDRIQYYMEKSYDYKTADHMALTDWINYIKVNKPKLLDKINFLEFLDSAYKLGCEVILLTARKECFKELTYQHVKDLDIDIETDKIYFNENKGIELKNILENKYTNYKNIIFIDDNIKNIINVQNTFENVDYNTNLYKIYHF